METPTYQSNTYVSGDDLLAGLQITAKFAGVAG